MQHRPAPAPAECASPRSSALRFGVRRVCRLGRIVRGGLAVGFGARLNSRLRWNFLRRIGISKCNRELVSTRELAQMPQCELLEKCWRRSVQERTTHAFTAAHNFDELTFMQRLEHLTAPDSTNLFNLRAANRLA